MKIFSKITLLIAVAISLASCMGSPQDSPQNIANVYAQSLCDMDIEGMASCFEGGEEALSLMEDYMDEEMYNYSSGDLQKIVDAAKESQLLPEISYEIVEENIKEDKGTIRIRFDMEFDDGEEVRKDTRYETISVYCHDGQWWIGEGYSKKDREMGRRFMNFINKLK
jgi:hypothetical protein